MRRAAASFERDVERAAGGGACDFPGGERIGLLVLELRPQFQRAAAGLLDFHCGEASEPMIAATALDAVAQGPRAAECAFRILANHEVESRIRSMRPRPEPGYVCRSDLPHHVPHHDKMEAILSGFKRKRNDRVDLAGETGSGWKRN